MEALDRLRPLLGSLNDEALQGRLRAQALEVAFVTPVRTDAQDLDFQKDLGPFIASRLLPLILLVMLGAGAVYPAVDLTAGEKERGTLETLLVSGASVNQVMAAKYATVALAAIASALANLVAMGITFASGLSFTGEAVTVHFTVAQLLVMLACLLPAALLLAGLSLALASTARTFKEGQSLMTPLLLVVMAPGFLAQMPGMELSTATALVPLLDVALLVKAVVLGTARPVEVLLTVAVVLACAGGSVLLAASAFRSETFRFGGEKGVK
jgi:ABC-type Na+ efflux pump permease subunit